MAAADASLIFNANAVAAIRLDKKCYIITRIRMGCRPRVIVVNEFGALAWGGSMFIFWNRISGAWLSA